MATVTGITAARAAAIEAASVVSGTINGSGHLILTKHDGSVIDAGSVVGSLDTDLNTIAALTPTNNDTMQYIGGAWANRTPSQVKTTLAIAEADVANLVTDLAAKAPIASPTFTGKATFVATVHTPVAISLAAGHAAIDANTGHVFDIAATASFTLDNPSNPTNGQVIHLRITQDATGGRLMTLGSAWSAGPNTVALSTAANKRDHLIAQYHSGSGKWDITGFQAGF